LLELQEKNPWAVLEVMPTGRRGNPAVLACVSTEETLQISKGLMRPPHSLAPAAHLLAPLPSRGNRLNLVAVTKAVLTM
jgi:hypothetical protein